MIASMALVGSNGYIESEAIMPGKEKPYDPALPPSGVSSSSSPPRSPSSSSSSDTSTLPSIVQTGHRHTSRTSASTAWVIPSSFYMRRPSNREAYSEQPNGQPPNVHKLLLGQKAFPESMQEDIVPKTLIICARSGADTIGRDWLRHLWLEKGFTLYCWNHEEKRIELIHDVDSFRLSWGQPDAKTLMALATKQLNLPAQQLQWVGRAEVDHVIYGRPMSTQVRLNIDSYTATSQRYDLDKLYSSHPNDCEIACKVTDASDRAKVKAFIEKHHLQRSIYKVQSGFISKTADLQKYFFNLDEINELNEINDICIGPYLAIRPYFKLDKPHLFHLQISFYSFDLTYEKFSIIHPALKRLELRSCDSRDAGKVTLTHDNLPSLHSLHMQGYETMSTLSTDSKMENLKKLEITCTLFNGRFICRDLVNDIYLASTYFPNVEILNIVIEDCKESHDAYGDDEIKKLSYQINFKNLKVLHVSTKVVNRSRATNSEASASMLEPLLILISQCKHLISVTLNDIDACHMKGGDGVEHLQLPALKKLCLKGTHLSPRVKQLLLGANRHIQYLYLDGLYMSTSDALAPHLLFTDLKYVSVSAGELYLRYFSHVDTLDIIDAGGKKTHMPGVSYDSATPIAVKNLNIRSATYKAMMQDAYTGICGVEALYLYDLNIQLDSHCVPDSSHIQSITIESCRLNKNSFLAFFNYPSVKSLRFKRYCKFEETLLSDSVGDIKSNIEHLVISEPSHHLIDLLLSHIQILNKLKTLTLHIDIDSMPRHIGEAGVLNNVMQLLTQLPQLQDLSLKISTKYGYGERDKILLREQTFHGRAAIQSCIHTLRDLYARAIVRDLQSSARDLPSSAETLLTEELSDILGTRPGHTPHSGLLSAPKTHDSRGAKASSSSSNAHKQADTSTSSSTIDTSNASSSSPAADVVQQEKPQPQAGRPYGDTAPPSYGTFHAPTTFRYHRIYDLSQAMVIQQLSQYLTIIQQRQELIPTIQMGICRALVIWHNSHLSGDLTRQQLTDLRDWDGQEETLTSPLHTIFASIIHAIDTPSCSSLYFYGHDFMTPMLSRLQPYYLSNGFHVVTANYEHVGERWLVWDSNMPEGPEIFYDDACLEAWVIKRLGLDGEAYIVLDDIAPSTVSLKLDANHFIVHGGLLILATSTNAADIVGKLPKAEQLKAETLHGLVRYYESLPLWLIVMNQAQADVRAYVLTLVQRFLTLFPADTSLIDSLRAAPMHYIENGLTQLHRHIDNLPKENPLSAFYEEIRDYVGQRQDGTQIQEALPALVTSSGKVFQMTLLAKTVSGLPMWIDSLYQPGDKTAFITSLCGYMQAKPDAVSCLLQSMASLTTAQQVQCFMVLQQIIRAQGSETVLLVPLADAILAKINLPYYQQQFEAQPKTQKWLNPIEKAMQSSKRSQLFWVEGDDRAELFAYHLLCAAEDKSLPVFFAYSPDDLKILPRSVEERDGQCTIHRQPGGRWYEFSRDHANQAAIVILFFDAEHFNDPKKIVQSYSFIDAIRHQPAFAQMKLIAVKSLTVDYRAPDFLSRFDTKAVHTISHDDFVTFTLPMPQSTDVAPQEALRLRLYRSPDWQASVLGRCGLYGQNISFQETPLAEAMASGQAILLDNAPWADPLFKRFWDLLMLQKQAYRPIGKKLELNENTTWYRCDSYDWGLLSHIMLSPTDSRVSMILELPPVILNPNTVARFFPHSWVNTDIHGFVPHDGFIKMHAGGILSICLTRDISENDWKKLCDACVCAACTAQGGSPGCASCVTLAIQKVPGTTLPDELAPYTLGEGPLSLVGVTLIKSTDIGTTVSPYQTDSRVEVIKVTGKKSPALFRQMLTDYRPESTTPFYADEQDALVFKALREGKRVVLYGEFSIDVVDDLTAYLQMRQQNPSLPQGDIVLVPSDIEPFVFMQDMVPHHVTSEEKREALLRHGQQFMPHEIAALQEQALLQHPLERLIAMLIHRRIGEDYDGWRGLEENSVSVNTQHIDPTQSEMLAKTWLEQRDAPVKKVLTHAPWVYITGLTGVGKTELINTSLAINNKIYHGLKKLDKWLHVKPDLTSDELHILALDEANLMDIDWIEALEGMLDNPPRLCIKGVTYILTYKHKIVFTGNPLSYGAGRTFADVIQRYGFSVYFPPLDPNVIYEHILKPLFTELTVDEVQPLCDEILAAYRFMCQCSEDNILITPRELKMLAIMAIAPDASGNHRPIRQLVHQIVRPRVPKAYMQAFMDEFPLITSPVDARHASSPSVLPKIGPMTDDYVLVDSRRPSYELLSDMLRLSSWRREPGRNPQQQYAGLHGLLFEGATGDGKTDMVTAGLAHHGYRELCLHDADDVAKDTLLGYYRPAANTPRHVLNEIFFRAHRYGHVVVIDEINTADIDEEVVNKLFSDNDKGYVRPERPGLLLIGTQNPDSTGARNRLSPALLNRCVRQQVPPYSQQNEIDILTVRHTPVEQAQAMVHEYRAKKQNGQHKLTLRHLLRCADRAKDKGFQCFDTTMGVSLAPLSHFVPAEMPTSSQDTLSMPSVYLLS